MINDYCGVGDFESWERARFGEEDTRYEELNKQLVEARL